MPTHLSLSKIGCGPEWGHMGTDPFKEKYHVLVMLTSSYCLSEMLIYFEMSFSQSTSTSFVLEDTIPMENYIELKRVLASAEVTI